jgi:hypothetical protein
MEKQPKKLLGQVRDTIRLKHYSIRTERSYVSTTMIYTHVLNRPGVTVKGPADL